MPPRLTQGRLVSTQLLDENGGQGKAQSQTQGLASPVPNLILVMGCLSKRIKKKKQEAIIPFFLQYILPYPLLSAKRRAEPEAEAISLRFTDIMHFLLLAEAL